MIAKATYEILKANVTTFNKASEELSDKQLDLLYTDASADREYDRAYAFARIMVDRYEQQAANTPTPESFPA